MWSDGGDKKSSKSCSPDDPQRKRFRPADEDENGFAADDTGSTDTTYHYYCRGCVAAISDDYCHCSIPDTTTTADDEADDDFSTSSGDDEVDGDGSVVDLVARLEW